MFDFSVVLKQGAAYILAAALVLTLAGCGHASETTETSAFSSSEAASVTDSAAPEADTAQGVAWLKSLEAKDPALVESTLKELHQQKLAAQRQDRLESLENGAVSVWSLFDDYAILGDSRATGFSVYGFLPESNVLAGTGEHIGNISDHMDALRALNPSTIFFCFGLNDITRWGTAEDYTEKYTGILAELRTEFPDADFYISSILPVAEQGHSSYAQWNQVDSYNAALKSMCRNIDGCYYIDNTGLEITYAALWAADGIHFAADFYSHWAANMILGMYDAAIAEDSTE